MGYEFELKFRATEAAQAAIAAQGQWHTITMATTYYDTPSGALSGLRYTLRRRLENGTSVCTLKTPAGELGRGEWETECDTIESAIPMLCKLGCPKNLPSLVEEGLIPVCGARFTRQASTVEVEGTVLEVALDKGILFAGNKEIPLCEVEIELKEGSREQAAAYALALAHQHGLQPEPQSKFKRALSLKEA